MNGLILHCGAHHIEREDMALLPTPEPKGSRHYIRPFIDDVDLVHRFAEDIGIEIKDEAYGVLRNDEGMPRRFFGLLQIEMRDDFGSQYGLMIGLRGSYDQSLGRALAVGSRVFVCDNLAFSGEVNVHTKQTLNIDDRIPLMLRSAVNQIPQLARAQHHRFDQYRLKDVTPKDGDAMLVELVRRGALVPSQLGRAIQEWDQPSHEEHSEDGRTLWRLHNAVTEAIKPTNPERNAVPVVWQRTRAMTDLFDTVADIDAPALLEVA